MDDEILKEFLAESYENLDHLDRYFVVLESNPADRDKLAAVFRTIHTIKGTSGFFGYARLQALTHSGENLLSMLRDGELLLNPTLTTALLTMVDAVRRTLDLISQTGTEGDEDFSAIIRQLDDLAQPEAPEVITPAIAAPAIATPVVAPAPVVAAPPVPPPLTNDEEPIRLGEILVAQGHASVQDVQQALLAQSHDPRHVGEILVDKGLVSPAAVVAALQSQQVQKVTSTESVRVDVSLLDKLMNLVGELVLARNQILQYSSANRDGGFAGTTQRLNLVTTEIQESIMKTRMQPIGSIWNKFPRVVRDLAVSCGKQVRLEMEGADTELDRTLIDAIKDPLTHIVRNSVDHGIEAPETRIAAGKGAEGRLILRAYHEGGKVNIEISDDGHGIDIDRVAKKLVDRGLRTAEQVARMTPRELIDTIFLPGFSTAEKVTNVSGRGVGMDVVRTNIERIGGSIDIQSNLGQGTTLRIKIPLTLAIVPALVVTARGERFAIPQVNLLELVRLEGDSIKNIEYVYNVPVYRLRGNLLPLVFLDDELELSKGKPRPEVLNIVVLQADERAFGLVLDGVHDTEEIVVKPLGRELKASSLFAGATIMGDGKVALILDVVGLAQKARVLGAAKERTALEPLVAQATETGLRQQMLLFNAGDDGVLAIPLAAVARLEEFSQDRVERSSGRRVIQYRGEVLPLVDMGEALGRGSTRNEGELQVIVYGRGRRMVGLVVDRIIDVVDQAVEIKKGLQQSGLLGNAVIQGKVTDLVDLEGLVGREVPDFLEAQTA